jgi:acyl-coenzyme A thioesterase PaaI-like protein
MSTATPPPIYPPERHVMRDLRSQTHRVAVDRTETSTPVVAEVLDPSGSVHLGVIATVVDMACAGIALSAASPDWIATADLSYHAIGRVTEGPLLAHAHLVRAGVGIIVIGVETYDGHGDDDASRARPAGAGLLTFSRIPASASAITIDRLAGVGTRSSAALPGSGFTAPILEHIGLRSVDPAHGVIEIDKDEYVRNSFGTINGGIVATVCAEAAAEVASAKAGTTMVATDLQVHYLAQTKAGPARTGTRVLRCSPDGAVVKVRLSDAGNDDLLLAMATVTLTPA